MRVATVNDDITLFEVRSQLTDEVIYGVPCFNEEDDLARTLELGNKFFDGVGPLDISTYVRAKMSKGGIGSWMNAAFRFVPQEIINLGGCTIVCDNIETFVIHIKNKILALDQS